MVEKPLGINEFCKKKKKKKEKYNGLGWDIITYVVWCFSGLALYRLAAGRTSTKRVQYIHTNTYYAYTTLFIDQASELGKPCSRRCEIEILPKRR